MCLVKIVYLIRVFKQLNFLVTMIITVCKNIVFFMILFSIFLLTFAQCTMLMQVDISAYGRTPSLMAHFIAMLRCSMGDFSLIDPWQSFDTFEIDENDESIKIFNHETVYVNFTWFIWLVSIIFLFMIFMNFIIAVIGGTYTNVIEYKEAHDYQQRLMMLYEREVQFSPADLENTLFFPTVLVVRKIKENNEVKQNWQNYLLTMKRYVQNQNQKSIEVMHSKTKETKQHITNSIKTFDNDLQNMYKEIEKVFYEVKRFGTKTKGPVNHTNSSKNLLMSSNEIKG